MPAEITDISSVTIGRIAFDSGFADVYRTWIDDADLTLMVQVIVLLSPHG